MKGLSENSIHVSAEKQYAVQESVYCNVWLKNKTRKSASSRTKSCIICKCKAEGCKIKKEHLAFWKNWLKLTNMHFFNLCHLNTRVNYV